MTDMLLNNKIRDLESELKSERESRQRQDKEMSNLRLDIEDLEAQLQEAIEAKEKEIDGNKRLKQEFDDMKKKMDQLQFEHEDFNNMTKRKTQEVLNDLNMNIEALSKAKSKFEKENKQLQIEIESLRNENDSLNRSKSQTVNLYRDLEAKDSELKIRCEELSRQINELNDNKTKLSRENAEYHRKVESLEFDLQQALVNVKRASQELDDSRLQLENEVLFRSNVEHKFKNLQLDMEEATKRLEEYEIQKDDLQKQMIKSQEEFKLARDKYEKEIESKKDEFEDMRKRLNNKLVETNDQLTETLLKLNNSEKNKAKLQSQIDGLMNDYELAKKKADETLRHSKIIERELEEYKAKLNSCCSELEIALHTQRNLTSELSKVKASAQQSSEQLELTLREKRKLNEEVDNLNAKLQDAHTSNADLSRKLNFSEADKIELQTQVDEFQDQIEMDQVKYKALVAQFEKYKSDAEKRLLDKEDEFNSLKQSHRRQIEMLQETIVENENKNKNELNSLRKKHMHEIEDLNEKYELTKKTKVELDCTNKRLNQANKEINDKLIEEQHLYDQAKEQLTALEKKNSHIRTELDELKSVYDRTEKSKKNLESELRENEERLSELQMLYTKTQGEKKQLEGELVELNDQINDLKIELKNTDEKLRTVNAALLRKEDELRNEKEILMEVDHARYASEQQLNEYHARLEEVEEHAKKEIKKISMKFESRMGYLEGELDTERGRSQEMLKELKRFEKRNRDLVDQINEEQAKVYALSEANDKLNQKVKIYRSQIEGAEGAAAANIQKCKRLQRELADAEERAQSVSKAFFRSQSVNRSLRNDDDDDDFGLSSHNEDYAPVGHLRSSYLQQQRQMSEDPIGRLGGPQVGKLASWRYSKYKSDNDNDDDNIVFNNNNNSNNNRTNKQSFNLSKNKSMSSTGLNNPYNNKSSSKNFEQFSPYASSTLKLPKIRDREKRFGCFLNNKGKNRDRENREGSASRYTQQSNQNQKSSTNTHTEKLSNIDSNTSDKEQPSKENQILINDESESINAE